ncbi:preprotein translocase subunit SecY [Mycoplasmopsis canis PG 14]|uniref:Protein translocase subunit SecY n=1 Tax=Mycoplasmopsis canis TaxID=29555 RepID=A0A449AQF2_9BACT|nr:preprotein translocase subunit SecY [Mycoplasmopsis canis]AMD81421.1 preprotein translocase subunit SecY [Mycoplasmopsis canis PG 14]EIE40902.1 preprotein translocase subunit SecY [Mycoplasmopsis canis PG 14]VEU68596.1 preprotein translocase subunit SecY [Mycoplasmopsis canis]
MQNLIFTLSKFGYKFSNNWKEFWSKREILKKGIYTSILLIIFVLGTTITAPFIKVANINQINDNSFLNTLNLIGGGGLRQFSLFALGISPFINASLIMMILQSKLVPPIYKMSQSGPQGRKKINVITRFVTLIIAYPQAVFLTRSLSSGNQRSSFIQIVGTDAFSESTIVYFLVPMILTAASLFALFISEQITNKGIGNGTSLIIFTGIASRLPFQFQSAYIYYIGDLKGNSLTSSILSFIAYIFAYLLILLIIAIVYVAERHIPIQQVGAGRSKTKKEIGKLPIKLNPGGIMPIIFAMMVLSFPSMIANILPDTNAAKQWININLQFTAPLGFSLLVGIVFVFSLLMGIQQSKVDKVAEDFTKNSTYIPGVRPGEDTQDYLIAVVFRLSVFSAFYLVILASMQFVQIMTGILPQSIAFGGTSLMILVSTALETVSQLQARRKSHKLSLAKKETYKNVELADLGDDQIKKDEGLLW